MSERKVTQKERLLSRRELLGAPLQRPLWPQCLTMPWLVRATGQEDAPVSVGG